MNAINTTGFKVFTCAAVALTLTVLSTWSFVDATSKVRLVPTTVQTVLDHSTMGLARIAAAALVD
jgi:hypothetical protein